VGLGGAAPTARRGRQHVRNAQQIVGEHRETDEDVEALAPGEQAARHAAPAEEDGDAALDPGAEPLPPLERPRLLVRRARRGLVAPASRETLRAHAGLGDRRRIARGVEAAVPRVQRGHSPEQARVALQGRADVRRIGGIAGEDLVVRDEAPALSAKKIL